MGLLRENYNEPAAGKRSNRGRMPSGKPNPVDVYVGKRIRLRRTWLSMSQEQLGEALGITFQQLQKYERGTNRISASRLWDLGRALDCSTMFFFEEMDEETAGASPRNLTDDSPDVSTSTSDPMAKREIIELVKAYYQITNDHVRRRIYDLTKSLGSVEAQPFDE